MSTPTPGVPWTSGTDTMTTDLIARNAAEEAVADGAVDTVNSRAGNVTGLMEALTRVAVKTTSGAVTANSLVPVDTTSGAVTLTLPTAPAAGTMIAIKHIIQGSTNAVTYTCGGSDVLNKTGGSTSGTLPLVNQGAVLHYATGIWTVIADDIPLSQLDLRHAALGANTYAGAQNFGGFGISNFLAVSPAAKTGDFTLAQADTGSLIVYNSASAGVVTLPNSLVVNSTFSFLQLGAGQLTFTAGASATRVNRNSYTKTAGQYAACSLVVSANSGGSAAQYVLTGDAA